MASPLAVFADTNALYPPSLRYLLIELAQADVIRLHWSPEILAELSWAILKERPDKDPVQLTAQLAELDGALPSASVAATPASLLIAPLPDAKDAHVLGSAWLAECSILLTFNLRHFPPEQLALVEPPITPMHPDAFLVRLLTTDGARVLPIIDRLRRRLKAPPLSVADYTASLAKSRLAQTAELLKHLLPL